MIYYRAKQEVRTIRCGKEELVFFTNGELVTPREFEIKTGYRMQLTSDSFKSKFEKVRICPKNTYFFFGVRFADEEKIIEITPV